MNQRGILIGICCLLVLIAPDLDAQRVYSPNSVLATGNCYKIGVKQAGIYKIDLNFLAGLGINTANLSSASIRLYGNGGGMLAENNVTPRIDDLFENAIDMVDGGDGVFNGSDYFQFYAPGPDQWLKDSVNKRFRHSRNLYADTAYYYLSIGGSGKRINNSSSAGQATAIVSNFDERYFYEKNLVSLLNSGKKWLGDEFDNTPGGNASRAYPVDWPGLILTEPVTLVSDMVASSVGATAGFSVKINAQSLPSIYLSGVSGNFLDSMGSEVSQAATFLPDQSKLTVNYAFGSTASGAQGWLDWFELYGRRNLSLNAGDPLFFRDWRTVAPGAVVNYSISNPGNSATVWEITDPLQPVKMNTSINGSQINFTNDASRLREYVAFTSNGVLSPIPIGKIANQNLHHSAKADMLIITHTILLPEAQRLAAYHLQRDNLVSMVVTTDQVFNEFSGGISDPTAIRDFVKMYYDKAGADSSARPKYLLLFGSGSYDYRYRISGNTNLVPVYESISSLDPLASYTSDDFFGLLNDSDDVNQNSNASLLDIGIGRIPARNIGEARIMVDKIIHYQSAQCMGNWRNQTVYVADDQDYNLHLTDAETISADADRVNPLFNQDKIYLDAYPVVSSSSGSRYPAVNDAIVNQIFNGSFIFNYTGHGSYQRLAEEAVLTQTELNRFHNPDKLPLFITASCDFAPHDDPGKNSLGAAILTGDSTGAIALLTTTRLVFAYSNLQINDNYLKIALAPAANGQYLSLGESVKQAKNNTSLNSGDILNNRKFTLLGDPALRLAFPALRIQLSSLNNHPITGADTLRALEKYTFTGMVTDNNGNTITNFNGNLQPTIYDKSQAVKTLGNDPTSPITSFNQLGGVLYKGNTTVTNGQFSFSFIVPKDINYQPGKGRISLYASNGITDANGINTNFYIGGSANTLPADTAGPVIQPYLNDDQFKNGGLTNENPILLVKLFDSLGISTSGNGIGHDITAVIDSNEKNILVLNNFYTTSQDSYQSGQVLFPLPTQTEGIHSIRIKAWDVADHSAEATLTYRVSNQSKLVIANLRNFPNPFTTSTHFAFEHNQPGTDLNVTIRIYDGSGRLVKEIRQIVNTPGSRNCEINWDGDGQSGTKLTKGLYIYQVKVVAGAAVAEKSQQLILF